jgi:hypothetical protein
MALILAMTGLILASLSGGLVVAQRGVDPTALLLVEEVPLEIGCGEVSEQYLQFVDADDIKLFRIFTQPGATVRVSVKDGGQPGDVWEACLDPCPQPTNVQTNVAIVPQNCATGDGNTFEYSDPAVAVADTGELCLVVRQLQGIDIWPAHVWVLVEVDCGGAVPGQGLGAAISTVISSVLFGQMQGVELYALPRMLLPGETVSGWDGTPLHVPGEAEWYIFIDRFPGANYEHPVQHVYVSAATGMITGVVDGTTPPRDLFVEMQLASNVVSRASDVEAVAPAAYGAQGYPDPPQAPTPPSQIPGSPETNPEPSNVAPQAFQNFVPSGSNLYVYYGGTYATVATTPLLGWLPVYVFMPSPGTLWLYEYYQSSATWKIYPFVILSSGWQQLWFQGDEAGWHSIIAYAGGAWTNWIHIYVGGASSACSVSPTALNFPSTAVGSSSTATFTITNNGGSILSGSVTESCVDYSVSPSVYGLLPGQSQTFTVTFAPTSSGTKTCTINTGTTCSNVSVTGTATSGAPGGCLVSPTTLNFGSVAVGGSSSQTFTITNASTGIIPGSVLEFCADFSVSPTLYFLLPGQSQTFTVTFTPTSTGPQTCNVMTSGACADVVCTGTGGVSSPTCSVAPTSLSFGTVPVGTSSSQSFTITNLGTGFRAGSISAPCPDFSVSPSLYFLTPGASVTVTVTFTPSASGAQTCTILTGLSCSDVTAAGTGGAAAPTCSVAPTSVNFGTVSIGSSVTQTFTVTNTGPISISGAISASCPEFAVSPSVFFLSPGLSITVTVSFAPLSTGPKLCTINVGGACSNVTASGTGGFVPPVGQKFALLLSGGVDSASNHARYLNDLTEIYWTLRNVYGYPQANIYVLYANGIGPGWVTHSASRANLFSVLANLQAMMGSNDEFTMFVTNHGGQIVSGTNQAKVWLWNYESIADWELANMINLLPGGAKKYFVFGQCYSGGMVDNLAAVNRHIAAACGYNEYSWSCDGTNDQGNCGAWDFDEFVLHWTAAVTGSYPNGAPLLSPADTNFDGTVSLDEAFAYAQSWDSAAETPQRSDPGGIGSGDL